MKRFFGPTLVLAALALPALRGPAPVPVTAAGTCPDGFALVSLDPSSPLYWNATFVQVFGSKDANGNRLVCAKFSSGYRNLTVVDDK